LGRAPALIVLGWCPASAQNLFCFVCDAVLVFLAGRRVRKAKGTVLLRKIRYGLIVVSPGLLRKMRFITGWTPEFG